MARMIAVGGKRGPETLDWEVMTDYCPRYWPTGRHRGERVGMLLEMAGFWVQIHSAAEVVGVNRCQMHMRSVLTQSTASHRMLSCPRISPKLCEVFSQ